MQLHTLLLILSVIAFLAALAAGVSARRLKFFGYSEMAKDVERLARSLRAETLRDGPELVLRGSSGSLPVEVRFTSTKDGARLNITMDAPSTFQMTISPASDPDLSSGAAINTEDGFFNFKFITTSQQPTLARIFMMSSGTLPLIKKLCWASSTSLRVAPGKLELIENPFHVPRVLQAVQRRLSIMEVLAEKLHAMPGADTVRITPFRKPAKTLKVAVGFCLAVALFAASLIPATYHESVFPSASPLINGFASSDANSIVYLDGWRLAQATDFAPQVLNVPQPQNAASSSILRADFSGRGNGRDTAYILVDDKGIMRLVILSQGKLIYDQRYQKILAVATITAKDLSTAEWREPLREHPDGDGLLLVTQAGSSQSSSVIMLRGNTVLLNFPADYQKLSAI